VIADDGVTEDPEILDLVTRKVDNVVAALASMETST
jgi:hypothetical protein